MKNKMEFETATIEETNTYSECMRAVLAKDITYYKREIKILVRAGTACVVDRKEEIAYVNGDHVDIERHEYSLIS